MTEFDGIMMPMEEKETLEANDITSIEKLQATSFRKVANLLGEDAAREIENALIEKTGNSFSYSKRKSLKTA